MSVTAAGYEKARFELATLFGWNAGALTGEQVLRLDCAVALRLGLDELQGRLIRGESVDMAKMLTASEALSRLLPAAVLAAPPEERREDPRKALFDLIMAQRERAGVPSSGLDERDDEIAALRAEVEQLRAVAMAAGLAVAHAACAAPTEADITPPGEIGEFYRGAPRPAPAAAPDLAQAQPVRLECTLQRI
jgi:hypothetical protein